MRSGQLLGHTPEQRVAVSTIRQYSFGLRLAIAQADAKPVVPMSFRLDSPGTTTNTRAVPLHGPSSRFPIRQDVFCIHPALLYSCEIGPAGIQQFRGPASEKLGPPFQYTNVANATRTFVQRVHRDLGPSKSPIDF